MVTCIRINKTQLYRTMIWHAIIDNDIILFLSVFITTVLLLLLKDSKTLHIAKKLLEKTVHTVCSSFVHVSYTDITIII